MSILRADSPTSLVARLSALDSQLRRQDLQFAFVAFCISSTRVCTAAERQGVRLSRNSTVLRFDFRELPGKRLSRSTVSK
jgi:hypothetical protein